MNSRASCHEDMTPPGAVRVWCVITRFLHCQQKVMDWLPSFSCPFLKCLDKASRQTGLNLVCSEITHKHAGRVTAVPSQQLSWKITCKIKLNSLVFQSRALRMLVKSRWCYCNCGFCFCCFQNGGMVSARKRNKALKSPIQLSSEPSSFQLHVSAENLSELKAS